MNFSLKKDKGFTLIELIVSVSIFAVAVTICLGAILSVFNANQKSKTLRSVMDNLNITMEGMTRTIHFGTNYHCSATTPPPTTSPLDCGSPGSSILYVRAVDGSQVKYSWTAGGPIMKSINGGVDSALTSTDVVITSLVFRVYGSLPFATPDLLQPRVVIVVSGYVGTKVATRSIFNLETTVSQRLIDFQ